MYKLIKNIKGQVFGACIEQNNILLSFPFTPDNTDYANFKKEILADEAQLQDADGNTMSATQAKDYVKELP